MDKYVILRDANQAMRHSQGSGFALPEMPGVTISRIGVPPDPQLETTEMTAAEARGAVRDPQILEIARAMPIRLIAPFADATEGNGGPTWGLGRIGADRTPYDGRNVRVAVLDTGIDASHPAFAGVRLIEKDFTGSGNGDGNGHGTHCAGTIFGRDVEDTRIGVARGVREALIGKVLGADGGGGSEALFDAMQWAVQEDARVISMSLGFDFPGFVEQLIEQGMPARLAGSVALEGYRMNLRVFDRLMALFRSMSEFRGGVVVVAASGNESQRDTDPDFEVSASVPAAAEGVISVGALGEADTGLVVAPFSNTNPVLSAPGVGVVSAKTGGGLVAFSGTSMACPHVAGAAALWWQALGESGLPMTQRAVEARLFATASRRGFAPGVDAADRGQGIVQVPLVEMS